MGLDLSDQLGTDELTSGKIAYILIFCLLMFISLFYAFNIPEYQQMAALYLEGGLLALVVWLISKVVIQKHDEKFPNPIIDEEKTLFGKLSGKQKMVIISFAFLVGLYIFFSISAKTTTQILAAPTFQLIEITPPISAIANVFAACVEDLLFFGFVTALVFGLSKKVVRFWWIAFIITLFLTPTIFMLYHMAHYGFTQVTASQSVWLFGLMMTSWVLILRNLWLPFFAHAGNNIAITLFGAQSVPLWGYFWFFTIIIIGLNAYFLLLYKH